MPFPLESLQQMQGFFWVLVRVSMIFFLLPIFGARGAPLLWKAGISLVISIVLIPVIPAPLVFPETLLEVVMGIMKEAILGLILAFSVKVLFASVQVAGEFMAFQMGFTMARAMDPMTGEQDSVLSQFLYLFMILFFFTIDGHHLFLRALASSFIIVPPNTFSLHPSLSQALIKTSALMFSISLKLAAPILVALFLSNLCLGIIARTVPQINILMIGFPVNIALGLIIFGLMLGNLTPFFMDLTKKAGEIMIDLLRLM